jgi:hypothetical protein
MTTFHFWKPGIYLYAPWNSNPPETGPVFSFHCDDIEEAVEQAKQATGLSVDKGQLTITVNYGRNWETLHFDEDAE